MGRGTPVPCHAISYVNQRRFKRKLRVIPDEARRIAAAEHRRRDANKNIVP